MSYTNDAKPSSSYSNDTKPSSSFTNDAKPTLGSYSTWASILTTWGTETGTWATAFTGIIYTNDSKPT